MPRSPKIYTRRGDKGTTRLSSGERVSKGSLRLAAYGTVDELNAQLGVVLASAPAEELIEPLRRVQNELFHVGAELSVAELARAKTRSPTIQQQHVAEIEKLIDRLTRKLPPLKKLIVPGGSPPAAHLHVARTVCRRAERAAVQLAQAEPLGEHVIPYLNRLSDALFVMARYQNKVAGVDEPTWNSRA